MIRETQCFVTPIYTCKNENFLKLENIFDNYITFAIKRDSIKFKNKSDFGWSYHSENMTNDKDLTEFQSFIENKCFELLINQAMIYQNIN
ncbi:MAG: hypothetical protein CM15mV27_1390 [Caudoviricetes sp.]|nr:MAG: hypothetical protein CM15mV27_1390 [Caudoviricetes sp.]